MFKIEMPEEQITPEQTIICIYGQPGTGKTTMAVSGTKPLLIDTDNGSHRIDSRYRVPTIHPKSYAEIIEVLSSEEINRFKTIVFDTFGNLLTLMDEYVATLAPANVKTNGELSLAGFGVRKKLFIKLMNSLKKSGLSVVFVAHDKEESGDDDKKVCRISASGSSVQDLVREMDAIGYVEMIGKNRTISFNPTQKYYAKNSLGLPSPINIPDIAEKNTFLQDTVEKNTEKKRLYEKQMKEGMSTGDAIRKAVAETTDKTFNDTIYALKAKCTTVYLKKLLVQEAKKHKPQGMTDKEVLEILKR